MEAVASDGLNLTYARAPVQSSAFLRFCNARKFRFHHILISDHVSIYNFRSVLWLKRGQSHMKRSKILERDFKFDY